MTSPGDGVVDEVAAALARLAPSGVRTGVRAVSPADVAGLVGEERASVAAARPVRRHEFASGRALLRQLLHNEGPIPVGASGAPAWPGGWLGSLAHDDELVIAGVAARSGPTGGISGLGIDLERRGGLDADEAALVLRPDEAGIEPLLAFVAKEAAYKAWSASGGGMLDHHDVRLRVEDDRFAAEVVAAGAVIAGSWCEAAGRYLALAVIAG